MRLSTQTLLNQHDICLPRRPTNAAAAATVATLVHHRRTYSAPETSGGSSRREGLYLDRVSLPAGSIPGREGKPDTVQRQGNAAKRQRGNLQETALTLGKLPDPPADPYPDPDLDDPLASRLTEAVGEGLYPSVARLNHSCRPNCKLGFDEFGCCVVRVRPGIKVRVAWGPLPRVSDGSAGVIHTNRPSGPCW